MNVHSESADPISPRLVGTKEVARALDISTVSVWKLGRDGKIPRHRVGRQFKYDLRQVLLATEHRNAHAGN